LWLKTYSAFVSCERVCVSIIVDLDRDQLRVSADRAVLNELLRCSLAKVEINRKFLSAVIANALRSVCGVAAGFIEFKIGFVDVHLLVCLF